MPPNKTFEALTYGIENRIGTITFNRPERRNALTQDLKDDLNSLMHEIQFDSGLGALIITGEGGAFCAGGDIKAMAGPPKPSHENRERFYRLHDWFQILLNLELPVIAAVDGPAYGAGFSLALAADFVLCSEGARLCCVFPRIGLVPDMGSFFTLPRIVGLQKAKEIMFTGRAIDAEEAAALGIAMSVHPADGLMAASEALAARLVKANTPAIGATKRILNQSFNLDAQALIEMEAAAQATYMASEYHRDAIGRFLEKQPLDYDWERMDREAGDT